MEGQNYILDKIIERKAGYAVPAAIILNETGNFHA